MQRPGWQSTPVAAKSVSASLHTITTSQSGGNGRRSVSNSCKAAVSWCTGITTLTAKEVRCCPSMRQMLTERALRRAHAIERQGSSRSRAANSNAICGSRACNSSRLWVSACKVAGSAVRPIKFGRRAIGRYGAKT